MDRRIFLDSRSTRPKAERWADDFVVPKTATGSTIRRLARDYLLPRWKMVSIAVGTMAFGALTTGALPFIMKRTADDVFVGKNAELLFLLAPLVAVVIVLRAAADYFGKVAQGWIQNRVVADLRSQLFEKIAFADLGYIQSIHSGRFVSVFMNDVNTVNHAAAQTLTGIARSGLEVAVLAAAMIYMDWFLSLIVLAALPLGGFLLRFQRRRARHSVRQTLVHVGALGSIVAQTLQSIRVVKAYHREAEETSRARRVIDRTMEHAMQTVRTRAASGPIAEALGGVAIALAMLYGGWRGIQGTLTLGEFMGFMTAAMLLFQPVRGLANFHNQMIEGATAAGRVFAIMDFDSKVAEAPGAKPLAISGGSIRFENITFGYDPATPVLIGFDLDVPAGGRIALVGPSGAGKSTVINLALRFFDPQHGRVLIDGQDVRGATIASARLASALLTQDPVLFDDTVKANIVYGSEGASDEAVVAAADAAGALDFITALPDGFGTKVGEGGNLLSGGQKQRIAFARAMLRAAPILLLDEPTSALDADAEAKIQKALDTLLTGRTVIVIAHRLSTVKKADMIVAMDAGRIVERGRHDELLALNGLYARLHRTQFTGSAAAAPPEGHG